tara:strand:+ start:1800 stop:1952 length:153 start_codon:yes stop_codon:yes gene_type:complete
MSQSHEFHMDFVHGFIALEEQTVFLYKCDALYQPESKGSIAWNDLKLGIH